jgi:hypothetical protein
MLVAELTVSHRTPFINKFRLWPYLVRFIGPWSIWSLLVTIFTGGVFLYILSPLFIPLVSCELSYWLRLAMVLWLKPMAPWWNRGPPVDAHTWLRYLASAGITVSSHNPLLDYIDMLSLRKLFLPREIHYWCQFDNDVSINDLWYHGETESLLWMCTQDSAAWRMLVSKSLVMIHCGTTPMCNLSWTPSLKWFLCCLWNDQATSIIVVGSKGRTTFMCGLFSLTLMVTTLIQVPFISFV